MRTFGCPRWSGTRPRWTVGWAGGCGSGTPDLPECPAGVEAGMFARRQVYLRGRLDDERAGAVAAQLMSLDALGDHAVDLLVDCADGTLDAALAVVDTIELMG